jgi:hypothetical protein
MEEVDKTKLFLVWVSDCEEMTLSTVEFNTKEEAIAYVRGLHDRGSWDEVLIFKDRSTATEFIQQKVKQQKK